MRVRRFSLHPYALPLSSGCDREGFFIRIEDERGRAFWGDVAPLPGLSQETLLEAREQALYLQKKFGAFQWTAARCLQEIERLDLFPSVSFGLESALLSLLCPLPPYVAPVSALLMGSPQEILAQAQKRYREGYTSAKLKVGGLRFEEARELIDALKEKFRLRIDVNRAWPTEESLRFFSSFPLNAFDYVEEPFQNPQDLARFSHPLAIDESFPRDLSLQELSSLPTLKALIYKPMIQGGLTKARSLYRWTRQRRISFVLSASFESDVGIARIASIAQRLSLSSPLGVGSYHYLRRAFSLIPFCFKGPFLSI